MIFSVFRFFINWLPIPCLIYHVKVTHILHSHCTVFIDTQRPQRAAAAFQLDSPSLSALASFSTLSSSSSAASSSERLILCVSVSVSLSLSLLLLLLLFFFFFLSLSHSVHLTLSSHGSVNAARRCLCPCVLCATFFSLASFLSHSLQPLTLPSCQKSWTLLVMQMHSVTHSLILFVFSTQWINRRTRELRRKTKEKIYPREEGKNLT